MKYIFIMLIIKAALKKLCATMHTHTEYMAHPVDLKPHLPLLSQPKKAGRSPASGSYGCPEE